MRRIEGISLRGPAGQSFSKLHGMLKPNDLQELLAKKEATIHFNIDKAWDMYGLSIIENDHFIFHYKDEKNETGAIVVKSIRDTENPRVKEITFIVLPARTVTSNRKS